MHVGLDISAVRDHIGVTTNRGSVCTIGDQGASKMNDMTFSVRGDADAVAEMNRVLAVQKAAHLRDGIPSAEIRINRIDRYRKARMSSANWIVASRQTRTSWFADWVLLIRWRQKG